jgi:hypothetical protein
MQKLLPLLMVSCFALGSCKGVRLGAAGVDAGGGSQGSGGSTGGVPGTSGTGGTARCPAGETLCSGCGSSSFCAAVCPTINCAVDAGSAGGAGGGGGTTGATGGTTSFSCAGIGCSPPPLCSEGCTARCGCCSCTPGVRQGDLICTKSGCYASAVAPDAGPDQAVDAPPADAGQAGAGGSGGTTGATGGTTSFSCANVGCSQPPLCSEGCRAPCGCCFCSPGMRQGDLVCTNGCYAPAVAPDAAGLDQAADAPPAAGSCENPLPLKCGDRLNHSTLIQGRPNVWVGYGCSQRWMSGPEAIYFLQPPAGCQAVVQLKNPSADLEAFVLPSCSFMSSCNFAPEVDQPSFVVVDGYNGAAGTYTLQVDCTCNQGPTIAPGATVLCERGLYCTNATGPCCPSTTMMNSVGMCGSGCLPLAITCDGPEDCSNGNVCCSLESAAGGFAGASCVGPAECVAPSRVVCHQQGDCPTPQQCGVPTPMPATVPAPPYPATWRVFFQVCAP